MKMLMLAFSLFSSWPALAETYTVVYKVPVPAALAPYSSFSLTYEKNELSDGNSELTYKLPVALVGNPQEFRFVGATKAPAFTLLAKNGEMSCEVKANAGLCKVIHHGVTVNLWEVEKALFRSKLPLKEKIGRFEVAAFVASQGGDLAGEMSYQLETPTETLK